MDNAYMPMAELTSKVNNKNERVCVQDMENRVSFFYLVRVRSENKCISSWCTYPEFFLFFNVSDVGLVIYSLKIMIIELFGLPPLFLVSRV